MKRKIFLMIACIVFCLMKTQAQTQNDTTLTIEQIWNMPGHVVNLCFNKYSTAHVQAPTGCTSFIWEINGEVINNVSPVTFDGNLSNHHVGYFYGCGYDGLFDIFFIEPNVPNETTEEIWKRQYETITLEAPEGAYNYSWNTGATTATIEVTEPGTYICGVSDMCATSMQTFIVKDNVEVYRATVDLETNLNKATWQVTEAQAEYISEVKIYRDGLLVDTAPYQDGYFLDAIGSDNAARNYHLVGITTEGEDCPIESYEKGTIHTTYYQDVNSNLNMTWNIPYVEEGAQGTLTYFQICKYDPNTEELTVVDQVNASITDYTCGVNQFDGGYAVIAAVFNDGKGVEELSFSNLTIDILGIGENGGNAFRIYPNPAKDRVTVEGTGILTVTNALGKIILTKEINGKITIDLAQGLYFVKLNNTVRKIVVE